MNDLGPLFDQPVPFQRHSTTSRQAARRARAFARTQAAEALRAWQKAPLGATDLEIHERTGIPIHLVPRCRKALQKKGFMQLLPTGEKLNSTGSPASVWVCTDEGFELRLAA